MKLYLHIGTEKTGTTSIQHFLQANRDVLRKSNILYPVAPGDQNHIGLAIAAQNERKSNSLRWIRELHTEEDVRQFREELVRNLAGEVRALPYTTAIISSEHCSSRLRSKEEVRWLRETLAKFFDPIFVVVYVRRQDDFLVSNYSTAIKGGGKKPLLPPDMPDALRHYDHWDLLRRWANVFGRERMICRKFERSSLKDEDIIADFLAIVGIADALPFERPPPSNESLDAQTLEFLRLLNQHVPRFIDRKINRAHTPLGPLLSQISEGPLLTLPEAELDRFMQLFQESNRKVAEEYFGGALPGPGDPLFGTRSDGRARVSDAGLTVDRAIEITAWLWNQKHAEVSKLKERVRKQKAKMQSRSRSNEDSPEGEA
ncbi:MAG TPA: hypothetical protein VHU18_00135 [Rhizomicrobium sp.]|nr:hypothetical protein [Rhizomicrobium sp.]